MKIGELDRRIQLWSVSTSQDAFGQPIESQTKDAEVWAKRFDRTTGEVVVADRVVSVVRTEFTIRHRATLNETFVVKADGVEFRIDGILTIGRNRFQKLMCSRRDD
jgi:SPP1 family predicted phage head-tail adaptor